MITEFRGDVRIQVRSGAVNLQLRGRSRAPGIAESVQETWVSFAGASPRDLPSTLHDVRVTSIDDSSAVRRFRIDSAGRQVEFQARGIQVHRDAGEAMFDAVPVARVPWHVRAGWSVLLTILAIPGIGSMILRQRSAP